LTSSIAAIDQAGSGSEAGLARLLLMLGLLQLNSQRAMKARDTLQRAVSILTNTRGEPDRQTGVGLFLLGRAEDALGRQLDAERTLRRAIDILEHHAGAETQLMHALATLGRILVDLKRPAQAAPLVARVQRFIAGQAQPPGPTLLRVAIGGEPPAVRTRMTVISPKR